MNIKLKYFILLSSVIGLSNNVFAVTQNIGCGGEIFGDTITTFFTSSTVTYNQVVTAGTVSSITMGQIYSDCNDAQYGSSVEPRCGDNNYGGPNGPYGGLSIDSPVQLNQQGVRNFVPTSANNTINTSGWTHGNQQGQCSYQFSYTVVSTQCSDGIDNDNDGSTDAGDPQCNNNCVANSQYAPNHNSESTPPNGTCPAPATLQLNGRAAFLQVVKNFVTFITTKAFATNE